MKSATFYLLAQQEPNIFMTQLCNLIKQYYQQGMRIFVWAENKTQAEQIDELLWQLPLTEFVPHSLVGESAKNTAMVEIGWQGVRHSGTRQVLINLTENAATFAPAFTQVIDFVPCDEDLKRKARERYKIYSMAGRTIETQAIAPR